MMMYYNQDPGDIHYVITMFACHLTAVTVLGLLLSVLMNKMVVDYVIKKGNLSINPYLFRLIHNFLLSRLIFTGQCDRNQHFVLFKQQPKIQYGKILISVYLCLTFSVRIYS